MRNAMIFLLGWVAILGIEDAAAHDQCTPYYYGCIWEHDHPVELSTSPGFGPFEIYELVLDHYDGGYVPIEDFSDLCPKLPPTVDPGDYFCEEPHPNMANCCLNWQKHEPVPTVYRRVSKSYQSQWQCNPWEGIEQAKNGVVSRCRSMYGDDIEVTNCEVTNGTVSINYPMMALGQWQSNGQCPPQTHPRYPMSFSDNGALWTSILRCDCLVPE